MRRPQSSSRLYSVGVGGGVVLRQAGQQDRADRDAEHARRQLHQAVGVVQPRHAAGRQERGEDLVEQQRDLAHRDAERRRRHEQQHAAHARVRKVEPPARQQAEPREERDLKGELQHAADEHRPGEHQHRRIEMLGKEHRADDERDVEQRRRDRRDRKAVPGVENAGRERDQRDEQDVREGDAQQLHRKRELARDRRRIRAR